MPASYSTKEELFEDILTALKKEHSTVVDDIIGGWKGRFHLPCSTCELITKAEGL